MLRDLMIMTSSGGMVIYEKQWIKQIIDSKTRLFGSLMTSMLEYSRQTTGMYVSYIEFASVSVSIARDEKHQLICTLLHDCTDGGEFGRLITTHILRSFIEEFGGDSELFTSQATRLVATNRFQTFTNKIPEVISTVTLPILDRVGRHRQLQSALLLYDDGTTQSVGTIDELGIVANLQALITFSSDIMLVQEDRAEEIFLQMNRSIVFINRVSATASFVSVFKSTVERDLCRKIIHEALDLLHKVFEILSNLHG